MGQIFKSSSLYFTRTRPVPRWRAVPPSVVRWREVVLKSPYKEIMYRLVTALVLSWFLRGTELIVINAERSREIQQLTQNCQNLEQLSAFIHYTMALGSIKVTSWGSLPICQDHASPRSRI